VPGNGLQKHLQRSDRRAAHAIKRLSAPTSPLSGNLSFARRYCRSRLTLHFYLFRRRANKSRHRRRVYSRWSGRSIRLSKIYFNLH